jgi:hypothetical protein
MYYDFAKELCKAHELDELMDKYVRCGLDPFVLREIAKCRRGYAEPSTSLGRGGARGPQWAYK